uniref:carbonic anhydrase n=1 Tax=Magallana gigas TaxID=29159 RepID=A0A8W8IPU6_MAGGI
MMMSGAFGVCCFFLLFGSQSKVVFAAECNEPDCSKAKFNYDRENCLGPVKWSGITSCWSTCNGNRQSPINIRRADATYSDIGSLTFNIDLQKAFQVSSSNSGFKTNFKVSEEDIVISDLTQFGLSGNSFKLDGIHYHAGKNNNLTGSEHSFDGEFLPMEQHMVFYNEKYSDVKSASSNSDGLLVIGAMVRASNNTIETQFPGCPPSYHAALSEVLTDSFDELEDYSDSGDSEESEESPISKTLTLLDLLPPDLEKVYTYEGSLTTPPCSETVTWIVMKCPITVSQVAVDKFKSLEVSSSEEVLGVHGNRRPVQRGQQDTTFTLLKNF